jgi:hypothetical protein
MITYLIVFGEIRWPLAVNKSGAPGILHSAGRYCCILAYLSSIHPNDVHVPYRFMVSLKLLQK